MAAVSERIARHRRRIARELKCRARRRLPPRLYNLLALFGEAENFSASLAFLRNSAVGLTASERRRLIKQLFRISVNVRSPHTQEEILSFVETILTLDPAREGVVVEAGCFKGSSTAKFSLAARRASRKLVVFDSFQGIPDNTEPHHRNIFGGNATFRSGDYRGSLEEVRANVAAWGAIDCCRFIPGWFEDTMPQFDEPVAAAYIDVDLVSSTRTCLRCLYPLLQPGGVIYSQDGHLPLVIRLLDDDEFWRQELGCEKPVIEGLGTRKLVRIHKPDPASGPVAPAGR